MVGNLLLGNITRDRFLAATPAGDEQPKFTAFAITQAGARHVIVKFSTLEESPVSERWRDLLLAEHFALDTLRDAGISAARTHIVNHGNQRFLEVERFDRVGDLGRRALISLAALDAEFVGSEAAEGANLLWAFGTLIGNSDMHSGNLSFISEQGRPYDIAPAYDMTPMAFAPRSSGERPDTLLEANIHASVSNETWRRAEELARAFLARLMASTEFSQRFSPCITALQRHIETASGKIRRLG